LLTSAQPEQREQAERLLDLTLDGLKPAPPQLPESDSATPVAGREQAAQS
jgi:hypothetical protein